MTELLLVLFAGLAGWYLREELESIHAEERREKRWFEMAAWYEDAAKKK